MLKIDTTHNIARRATFKAGTTIFEKGEARDNAYIIDSGEIHIAGNVEGGSVDVLSVLGPGEIFGEMALIDEGPRTAKAIAAKTTEVFVIPSNIVQQRLQGLDPLILLLVSLLVERYRITRINMPETIKQDSASDLLDKLQKIQKVPKELESILDAETQREQAIHELKLEQELRNALSQKQFVPFLQPILKLPERKILGFEALIRWKHPERGIVPPIEFIPIAERTGVIRLLDALMLEKACEFMPTLIEAAGHDIFVSINLSGINFGSLDLIDTVKDILHTHKTDPKNIHFEITESALIQDPESAEAILQSLKDLGFVITLDDFGTGYSSLSYLHNFTLDTLKIDRAFISQMDKSQKSLDIVRAIQSLAQTFKLKTVAEGVERDEEVVALSSMGCDMGQGFLFGRPVSFDDTLEFLKKAA